MFVPAGVPFKIKALGVHAAAYVFCSSGGLVECLIEAGAEYKAPVLSEEYPITLKDEALYVAGEKWGLKIG